MTEFIQNHYDNPGDYFRATIESQRKHNEIIRKTLWNSCRIITEPLRNN